MIGIITINDNSNYGNRLQNYAVNRFFEDISLSPENLLINDLRKKAILKHTHDKKKRIIKRILPMSYLKMHWKKKQEEHPLDACDAGRERNFILFTEKYTNSRSMTWYYNRDIHKFIHPNEYDYFLVGSDQVWNPDFAGEDVFFLDFAPPSKRIAFSASIGYDKLPEDVLKRYRKYWNKMRYISVREDSAADLVELATGKRPDVFLDPTMLLAREEWEQIAVRPKTELPEKYIFCLFLGDMPEYLEEKYESEYGMKVVTLNDKRFPDYFALGPSEFVYLIAHAQLVLTDSFHCTVFATIFHKPFWVFQREQSGMKNMFTRMENLLSKLGFTDRVQERNAPAVSEEIAKERFLLSDEIMREERVRVTGIMEELLKN